MTSLSCYNVSMFMVGLISWWYGRGWVDQWRRMSSRFMSTLEFFSIGQLIETLFSPYRQISANTNGNGSFGDAVRASIDKLFSRGIGAIIRSFTIIVGIIAIIFQGLYEAAIMVAWWFVPILPIAGFILLAIGWVPTWQ